MPATPRSTLTAHAFALAVAIGLVVPAMRPICAMAAEAAAGVAAPVKDARPPAGSPLKLFADSRLVTRPRLSVEVVGQGPDVVLVPGLGASRETWRRTAERLRGRYRLHLVQVAGFAGEPPRDNASGPVVAPTVADLDAYIVSAGLKTPAVVGHSLGGVMALELAIAHPGHVGRVMVVDALAFYTELFAGPQATAAAARPYADAMGARMLAASEAERAESSRRLTTAMASSPADQARIQSWSMASDRATLVGAMQEDMTTDLRPALGAITAPVTVIYEAPLKALIEADYAPLRRKTLVAAAPGARHFLMYDDPAGFDAALDAFLAP